MGFEVSLTEGARRQQGLQGQALAGGGGGSVMENYVSKQFCPGIWSSGRL